MMEEIDDLERVLANEGLLTTKEYEVWIVVASARVAKRKLRVLVSLLNIIVKCSSEVVMKHSPGRKEMSTSSHS